jgi:hypothetical protein
VKTVHAGMMDRGFIVIAKPTLMSRSQTWTARKKEEK